jgi:hypothetical protein
MFNMNEGYNLNPKPEPSIIDKLAAMDIDIRKLRVKHSGASSSYMSDSTTQNSFRVNEPKSRHYGANHKTNDAVNDFFSDMNMGAIAGHHSLSKMTNGGTKHSEMSLEEKILGGFYNNGPKN